MAYLLDLEKSAHLLSMSWLSFVGATILFLSLGENHPKLVLFPYHAEHIALRHTTWYLFRDKSTISIT